MKKTIFIIIGIIIMFYLIMVLNTNSIVREVKNIMSGNVKIADTQNTPLNMYNFSDTLLNAEVNVKITRLFVLHNFFDGYIWVNYTYETIKNDNGVMPCSTNILSKWKIHKENGIWKIIEIIETP